MFRFHMSHERSRSLQAFSLSKRGKMLYQQGYRSYAECESEKVRKKIQVVILTELVNVAGATGSHSEPHKGGTPWDPDLNGNWKMSELSHGRQEGAESGPMTRDFPSETVDLPCGPIPEIWPESRTNQQDMRNFAILCSYEMSR
jgi:hypothetical protein